MHQHHDSPADEDMGLTLEEVLVYAPEDGPLTEEVREKILEVWETTPAAGLVKNTIGSLVVNLGGILDELHLSNSQIIEIAEALHALLIRFLAGGSWRWMRARR